VGDRRNRIAKRRKNLVALDENSQERTPLGSLGNAFGERPDSRRSSNWWCMGSDRLAMNSGIEFGTTPMILKKRSWRHGARSGSATRTNPQSSAGFRVEVGPDLTLALDPDSAQLQTLKTVTTGDRNQAEMIRWKNDSQRLFIDRWVTEVPTLKVRVLPLNY
jgi:hypothetical protein